MPKLGEQLDDVRTVVDPEALAVELTAAWRALRDETPQRGSILVLMAHSALETGRWKSCHCWNLGNVKSKLDDGRDFTFFRCNEVINGKVVWFDPPHPFTRFRAFRTLREGALDHLAFLMGMKRYAEAWPFVLNPDPDAFVHALKAGGYFTADPGPYAHAVASIYREYSARLPFEPAPVDPELDDETKARAMERVALCLNELAEQVYADARPGAQSTDRPPPDDPPEMA